MDERRHFGAVLKRFRLAAGLTHEALAERASLGARTISDLERGVSRAPRADTLALLVEALGLSPEQRTVLEAAARPATATPDSREDTEAVAGTLSVPLTRFIGREDEVGSVPRVLLRSDVRLVTLTGAGGVGKTRLAIHVASRLKEAFADGVVAVALAPVADRDGAVQAIGRAISGDDRRHSLPNVVTSLARRELLLVLDNCEHLVEAVQIVAELLRGGSRLKILATSRAPLRVSGEQEYPVSPLPIPDVRHLPSVPALADNATVALFVDRAARVRPDFALTAENAATIAAICARLDGLPLAVELAAARIKVLPPRMLLERLNDATSGGSLDLLTGGARDLPERHQTLRDTIAWSHDLLTPSDQTLFRRLSVFHGGCTLEAAEAICSGGQGDRGTGARSFSVLSPCPPAPLSVSILDGLASLVDKSLLVQGDGPDGEPRFVMFETIREYAREQLIAASEERALLQRHAEYYLALVEETGGLLFAAARKRAKGAAEQGNVQAALRWLVQHG
jgi:predicted ATPase